MDTAETLILVLTGVQGIAILVGIWVVKSIIELKVMVATFNVMQESHEKRIHNLEEYRQSSESKVKELWGHYKRDHRDSKGGLESFRE